MPNIELMAKDYRGTGGHVWGIRAFNPTKSVGIGCTNLPADVKLIQCIFTTLAMNTPYTPLKLGTPNENIPPPNGRYTAAMGQVILNYQRRYTRDLLSVDGRIHRASFLGRALRGGFAVRRMTIQLLNEHLGETSLFLGGSIDGGVNLVLNMFPELKAILTDRTWQMADVAESGLQILLRNLLDDVSAMKELCYLIHKAHFEALP